MKIHEHATYERDFHLDYDLSEASSVRYAISGTKGEDEVLLEYTDGHETLSIDEEEGVVGVKVLPADLSAHGRMWEELRVSFSEDKSHIVEQNAIEVSRSATVPESGVEE